MVLNEQSNKNNIFCFSAFLWQDITYENNIKEDLIFLADDKLEGRKTGTEGEKLAAKYISERFEKLNLSDKGTKNYYQDFYFGNNNNPHEEIEFNKESDNSQIHARNVVGFLDNGGSNTVVIGAHYDHLVMVKNLLYILEMKF